MRVRHRQSEVRHRGGSARRGFLARRERPSAPVAEPDPADGDDLFDERRLRASGGPNDRAQYACGCGHVWEADVSTSVACPHCGTAQAW